MLLVALKEIIYNILHTFILLKSLNPFQVHPMTKGAKFSFSTQSSLADIL